MLPTGKSSGLWLPELAVLMLSLSLLAQEQLWRVIWGVGALVAVLDALFASRLLDLRDRG